MIPASSREVTSAQAAAALMALQDVVGLPLGDEPGDVGLEELAQALRAAHRRHDQDPPAPLHELLRLGHGRLPAVAEVRVEQHDVQIDVLGEQIGGVVAVVHDGEPLVREAGDETVPYQQMVVDDRDPDVGLVVSRLGHGSPLRVPRDRPA
jgi:hypothetical protein